MRILTLLLVPTLMTGCLGTGGGGGDGDGSKTVKLDNVASEYAKIFCDQMVTCNPLQGDALDTPDCAELFASQMVSSSLGRLIADVEAGKVIYDGEKAAECMSAFKAMGCGDSEPDVCEEVFAGTAATGAECTQNQHCADGWCNEDEGCPGVCATYKQAGEACDWEVPCAKGLDCMDDICKTETLLTVGAACTVNDYCQGSAVCVSDTAEGSTGTCTLLADLFNLGEGASCDVSSYSDLYGNWTDPDLALCQAGLSCVVDSFDPSTESLVATCRKEAASGGACGAGLPDQCPAHEYCDADFTSEDPAGTCKKLPVTGEACLSGQSGYKCKFGYECMNDVCIQPADDGASCASDQECLSNYCDSETSACAAMPECYEEGGPVTSPPDAPEPA